MLVCVLLVVATLAVYWPVRHFDFVNFDDTLYVVDNPSVRSGLTWNGLAWAFGRLHGDRTYWHPLAWVSHMVDCEFFGLKPGGHHTTNVLFHVLNTGLVFLVFHRMTRAVWRCAALAGMFALHPLQVDTVAWVAERKNLLAALFALLTIWTYASYVLLAQGRNRHSAGPRKESDHQEAQHAPCQEPASGRQLPASMYYWLSLGCYALSLMSKPVLVTVPFLLLLLDCWPLNRLQAKTRDSRAKTVLLLFREKLPFLVLSAASGAMTILSHHSMGMLEATRTLPLSFRLENALVSYARYLGNALWPSKLAVFYPLPPAWPTWSVAFSGALLVAMSALAIRTVRNRPYLFVGWFWFVGVLVPFVGLIQVGAQAMADRFAYFPLVGLFLSVVWAVADLACRRPTWSRLVAGAVILALILCAVQSQRQLGYWRNSITLFGRALAVTTNNYIAHLNLGNYLAKQGQLEKARRHLTAAMDINPYLPETHYELGRVLFQEGRTKDGAAQYRQAVELRPNWAELLNNLAWLLATHPRADCRDGPEAVALAERACRLTGGTNLWMVSTLAAAYAEAGRFAEAATTQQEVCDLATAQGTTNLAERFQHRLELYRSGLPYHEP